MKKVKKMLSIIERNIIKSLSVLYNKKYMKYYTRYLKKIGIKIQGNPNFIATSVYFDGADYSKITLGNNVTISREVMLLTHDGSMHTVHKGLQLEKKEQLKEKDLKNSLITIKEISIGENSFIGADRKSTRLNSSNITRSRMPSSA